jgi:hypothetical protein
MKDESNPGADRSIGKSSSTRFSPTRMAAAGFGGAIVLLVVMVVVYLLGLM